MSTVSVHPHSLSEKEKKLIHTHTRTPQITMRSSWHEFLQSSFLQFHEQPHVWFGFFLQLDGWSGTIPRRDTGEAQAKIQDKRKLDYTQFPERQNDCTAC